LTLVKENQAVARWPGGRLSDRTWRGFTVTVHSGEWTLYGKAPGKRDRVVYTNGLATPGHRPGYFSSFRLRVTGASCSFTPNGFPVPGCTGCWLIHNSAARSSPSKLLSNPQLSRLSLQGSLRNLRSFSPVRMYSTPPSPVEVGAAKTVTLRDNRLSVLCFGIVLAARSCLLVFPLEISAGFLLRAVYLIQRNLAEHHP
jgi:hypothetical protein